MILPQKTYVVITDFPLHFIVEFNIVALLNEYYHRYQCCCWKLALRLMAKMKLKPVLSFSHRLRPTELLVLKA